MEEEDRTGYSRLSAGAFGPAVALAATIVAVGPFLGRVRDVLLLTFPRGFVPLLGGVLGVAGLVSVLAALREIRDRRPLRLAGVGVALGVVVLWIREQSTGNVRVDAVERIHFVFYGLLSVLLWRAARRFGPGPATAIALLGAAIAGTVDELAQWWVPSRIGDVRDVLLNVVAGAAGTIFAASVWPASAGEPRRARRGLVVLAGTAVLLFALFLDVAHLGFEIRDPEAGRFRSWFTPADLASAATVRRAEWSPRPPGEPGLLSKEDFFRTEAGWHVQQRNAAMTYGDLATAWCENRILERWYGPFLELTSARSGEAFRLAPWDRERLEAARPKDAPSRTSPALAERIFLSPTGPQLWAATVALLAALALTLIRFTKRPE